VNERKCYRGGSSLATFNPNGRQNRRSYWNAFKIKIGSGPLS
jgi:hypothetical protein